jgi:hypothetical protein
MHKSRIIVSANPKIMINSQDVHFGITRQCAQVELKNLNIFRVKCTRGPSICKKVSLRSINFENAFLGS